MFVSSARVLTPHSLLSATSVWPSSRALSSVGMNAAAPNFTSSTRAFRPSAWVHQTLVVSYAGTPNESPLS